MATEANIASFYRALRPLVFLTRPEFAHHATLALLRFAGAIGPVRAILTRCYRPRLSPQPVRTMGLTFPNAIGLAAGYDKDGTAWRGLATLGFGHLELGTITPLAQPGNPKPRVFRLVQDEGVINRMGFPNRGISHLKRRLFAQPAGAPLLGISLGKNRATPLDDAWKDYAGGFRELYGLADYFAINISSPNTPHLRELQREQALRGVLAPLVKERNGLDQARGRKTPLLVKLSPDLSSAELESALAVILSLGIDGIIVGNTTEARPALLSPDAHETGGLSGAPLNAANTAMIAQVAALTRAQLPIVASGGILRPDDALAKLEAGATLLQLYTGLIYYGPALVRDTVDAVVRYQAARAAAQHKSQPVHP